jgi:hypothetical protein
MAKSPLLGPPVTSELFDGDLYETPALARRAIDSYDFGLTALPFMSLVKRKRAREAEKAALASIPRRFEDFKTDKLSGKTGTAKVYISRKIANETQPIAQDIRAVLTPATLEGTYRALGLGGWHATIAKAHVDMEGMAPDEFAESISDRLKQRASGLLVPIGGVAVVGARVCGNKNGGRGSSRFIGLTPHQGKGLLEEMRTVRQLFDPMVDVTSRDWYNTPHISVAKAEDALFELPEHDRQRLEDNILTAVEERALRLRPLTLTAACVEISDL